MSYEKRLKDLNIVLSEPPAPLGAYIPCSQSGNLLFISGMLPLRDGRLLFTGKVGTDVSLEEAQAASHQAVVNALSIVKSYLGTLDKVSKCIKLNGYVASSDGFVKHPEVINAASALIYDVFGEIGRHARAAVGVNSLPLNAPVEIDFIFEITL